MSARTVPFFSPTQISGCQLWLDAADTNSVLLSGSNVTQWNDKSGNNRNLTQATVNSQPIFLQNELNSNSIVSFRGSNFFNGNLDVNGLTTMSVFFIEKPGRNLVGRDTEYPIFQWPQTAGWGYVYFVDTQQRINWRFGTGQSLNQPTYTNPSPSNTYRILVFTKSGLSENLIFNGTTVSSYTAANTTLAGNATSFTMGYDPLYPSFGIYDIGEVLIYTSALSIAQRQQIEGYLAWKWGLQANLPATHPYKSSPIAPLLNPPTTVPGIGSGPFFTPRQIPGCGLWLDAADTTTLTLSGTSVTQWKDKSGNGRNTTAVGGSPVYSSNRILLDGSSTYLVGPYVNTTPTLTAFVIATVDFSAGTNNYYRLLSVGSTAANDYNNTGYAALILRDFNTTNIGGYRNSQTNYVSVTTNTTFLLAQQYDGSTGQLYFNGNSNASVASSGSFNTTSYSIGRDVGNIDGSAPNYSYAYWPGSISEVILFTASLTTGQRQQVEGYLAWKWGLQTSLPTTHPYFSVPVTPFINQTPLYSPWLPTQISGCQLWFDGADPNGTGTPPANNTALSSWVDKSGSGNSMTAVGSPQPTYVSQSRSISYDGSSYFQKTSLSFTNYTFFAIARKTSGNGPLYTNTTTTANSGFFQNYTADGNYYLERGNTTWAIGTSPFTNGTTYMYSVRYAPDNTINVWSNGGINPAITTTRLATITQDSILLGKRNVGVFTETWVGTFSEVIQYNNALTTTQRQQIEGYLAWKWGLQANLPSAHPYFSVPIVTLNSLIITPQISAGSWLPTRVSGCSLWLDAADPNGSGVLPSNGASVTTWADKSGNNYNVSQNASLAVPVFRKSLATNGLPGLDFTGGGGLLSATSFAKSLNVTMLLVGMVKSSIGGWGTFWGHFPNGDHDNNAIQLRNTSGQTVINWHTNNNNTTSQLSYTLDSMVLYSCTMTNGNIMFMQQTNTSGTNSVTVTNGTVTINTNTAPIWVGRSDITGEAINSYIYEIVYFQRVLSLSERQQTEGHLAWKWGLQGNLPASHPFKNWPPPP